MPLRPSFEAEDPLPTLEGRALCFGLELSAAQMLAPNDSLRSSDDTRRVLFATLDPGLALRLCANDVIVAEQIFGTDDAARPALAALAVAGVRALVARRFDHAIRSAAAARGIVTIALAAPSFLHTGDRLRLDLDAGKIVNLSSGDRAAIDDFDDHERARLRAVLAVRSSHEQSPHT